MARLEELISCCRQGKFDASVRVVLAITSAYSAKWPMRAEEV